MYTCILRTLVLTASVAVGAAIGTGGEAQAEPLKITVTKPKVSDGLQAWYEAQMRCLTHTIYTEARGEGDEGQLMVAWVVVERTMENRPYWGGDLCEVTHRIRVSSKGALVSEFSGPIHHAVMVSEDDPGLKRAEQLAWLVVRRQWQPPQHLRCARYYLNKETADPSRASWFKKLQFAGNVGKHAFYCDK